MKNVTDIQGTGRFVAQYKEIVTKYAQAAISQNTQRAYRSA
jgi:hypothetical protein